MIALLVLNLLLTLGVFLILRRLRLILRVLIAGAAFVVMSIASVYLASRIGDPPPLDSAPITNDALEKEGMSREEWEEYESSQDQKRERSRPGKVSSEKRE